MAFRSTRSPDSDDVDVANTETPDQDHHDHDHEHFGPIARVLDSLSSAFSHPAAGKLDPPVDDIASVSPEKAATLRNAGYETALDVYEADRMALTDTLGDRAYAGYLQHMAERTLEISEATIPASSPESHSANPHSSSLTDIRQIGDARARVLRNAGYTSVADVAKLGTAILTNIEGISETRAETILDSANDLLDEHPASGTADTTGGA